jgi:hypothetical protein
MSSTGTAPRRAPPAKPPRISASTRTIVCRGHPVGQTGSADGACPRRSSRRFAEERGSAGRDRPEPAPPGLFEAGWPVRAARRREALRRPRPAGRHRCGARPQRGPAAIRVAEDVDAPAGLGGERIGDSGDVLVLPSSSTRGCRPRRRGPGGRWRAAGASGWGRRKGGGGVVGGRAVHECDRGCRPGRSTAVGSGIQRNCRLEDRDPGVPSGGDPGRRLRERRQALFVSASPRRRRVEQPLRAGAPRSWAASGPGLAPAPAGWPRSRVLGPR